MSRMNVRRRKIVVQEKHEGGDEYVPVSLAWEEAVEAFLAAEEYRGLRRRTIEIDAQELKSFHRWLAPRAFF